MMGRVGEVESGEKEEGDKARRMGREKGESGNGGGEYNWGQKEEVFQSFENIPRNSQCQIDNHPVTSHPSNLPFVVRTGSARDRLWG